MSRDGGGAPVLLGVVALAESLLGGIGQSQSVEHKRVAGARTGEQGKNHRRGDDAMSVV